MIASKSFKRRPSAVRIFLHAIQVVFLVIGILALGYYGYVRGQARAFQAYQSWRLDQLQQGKPATISLFLKQWIPIPWTEESAQTTETKEPQPVSQPTSQRALTGFAEISPAPAPGNSQIQQPAPQPAISEGSLIGRIEIPRIDLSAIVLEGIATSTLRLAVGHLPGTPLPGANGNIDLAAHRDTYFRGLKKVQKGDTITLSTVSGAQYKYRVESINVVSPNNTDILNSSAGPGLNLITCYPFNYIGSAPKRFVVHADEVGDSTSQPDGHSLSEALPVSLQENPEVSTTSPRAHESSRKLSRQSRHLPSHSPSHSASRARGEELSTEEGSQPNISRPSSPSRPARIRAFFKRVFGKNKSAGG